MRIAALSAPPVPAPMEQPVVRVLMDDGESYLTHEMEGASGDGRLPQMIFTTNKERAKVFQVTDWDESTRTFGLRCDLGFLTNADGEVRAGAQKKSKHETWTAIANGAMSNQEQFQAGYLEGWRVNSAAAAASSDKLAVDVPNKDSELNKISQFKFEPVDQSSMLAKTLSGSSSQTKRPLGSSGNSLMEISQLNQKKMRKSGGAVKPPKKKKPKAIKDPNAPTKPRNAYHYFCADQRETVKSKYPDMEGKEVSKQLGADWQMLSDEDRKQYVTAAEADKARWTKEKEEYDLQKE